MDARIEKELERLARYDAIVMARVAWRGGPPPENYEYNPAKVEDARQTLRKADSHIVQGSLFRQLTRIYNDRADA